MINDPQKLREVLEEIAEWTLDERRWYIAETEKAFGAASAQQLKDGLVAMWRNK
jgi:hypothetical protein